MSINDLVIRRTEYPDDGLGDPTSHGQSRTDLDSYLLPAARIRTLAQHGWGVAAGLRVSATTGATSVSVEPGTALDALGRSVFLVKDGKAITDPAASPTDTTNVPTMVVSATGASLATTALTGDHLVTLTWREVIEGPINAPEWVHAPWCRLVPAAGFTDAGDHVVLALVSLGPGGAVTGLSAGPRRVAGTTTGRIRLRRPVSGASAVEDATGPQFVPREDGGLDVQVTPTAGMPVTALTITPAAATRVAGQLSVGGDVQLAGSLSCGPTQVTGPLTVDGAITASGMLTAGPLTSGSITAQGALTVSAGATIGGTVEAAGGLGVTGAFSSAPSGPEGSALDVARRMRVRQGGDGSAGIWFHQRTPNADRAFVGMLDDTRVGIYGAQAGWGLTMNVTTGAVSAARGIAVAGVSLGQSDSAVTYPWSYETVGVTQPNYNLRLQSPNAVYVHAQGAERLSVSADAVTVHGDLRIRGRLAISDLSDGWLRLNQATNYGNGVHTPGNLTSGGLNIGGVNGWGHPGWGNVWIAGSTYQAGGGHIAGSLLVDGNVQLGNNDGEVTIGGNQSGPFMALHDDLWFADPQDGSIEIRDGNKTGWGKMRGRFLAPSSRDYKYDITPLSAPEIDALAGEALDTALVWYRYHGDDEELRPRVGLIAEEAPDHLVEDDRRSMSLPESVAVLLACVQRLNARIAELETPRTVTA